jgi:hypothetical protein
MSASVNIAKVAAAMLRALDDAKAASELGEGHITITVEACDKTEKSVERDPLVDRVLKQETHVLKTSEERYVLGVVLEPLKEMGSTDTQNDTYSAEEVRRASHRFMEEYGTLGLQHQINITGRVRLLENYIAPSDFIIDGQLVKAGTWMMGIRVVDNDLWSAVKDGRLTGFSIGGAAVRTPVNPPT